MEILKGNTTHHRNIASLQHGASFQGAWNVIFQYKVLLTIGAGYLLLVRILRYQRISRTNARFPTRQSLAKMTVKEAQEIVMDIGQYEMPFFQKKGLSFALFRTYGIPTISSLLVETTMFTKPESASKRYVDTYTLMSEQVAREVGSKGWVEATSRMNCIHQRYQVAGKISNEDMIYTLALFAGETIAWIDRYDWRHLSEVEKCALAIYWSFQGEAMGIVWRGLPTFDAGKKWKDGLHFLEEWLDWATDYETRYMLPADTNFQTAEQTTAILLWVMPDVLKPFGKKAVTALMDDRLRISMKYPPAPSWLISSIRGVLQARAFLIRNFFLPRFYWTRNVNVMKEADENGKFFSLVRLLRLMLRMLIN